MNFTASRSSLAQLRCFWSFFTIFSKSILWKSPSQAARLVLLPHPKTARQTWLEDDRKRWLWVERMATILLQRGSCVDSRKGWASKIIVVRGCREISWAFGIWHFWSFEGRVTGKLLLGSCAEAISKFLFVGEFQNHHTVVISTWLCSTAIIHCTILSSNMDNK